MRYLDLADALRARIVARDVGAGGALAGEVELAREYGTSRVTVRRALDLLRQEGLVTSRRGAGWFAAVDPVRQPLGRVTTVEAAVEAAGAAPGPRDPRVRFRRRARRRSPTPLHVDRDAEVLRVERVNLADDEPFALVTVWVRADVGADVSRADVERVAVLRPAAVARRRARLACTRRSPPRSRAAASARLLGVRARRTRCCSAGASRYDAAGVPTLVSEHRYPADRTTFEIEFSLRAGALQHA